VRRKVGLNVWLEVFEEIPDKTPDTIRIYSPVIDKDDDKNENAKQKKKNPC